MPQIISIENQDIVSKNSQILIRIASEIFLKGKNQHIFLKKLRKNIKKLTNQSQIIQLRSRISMPYFKDHNRLLNVFGIHSYSIAYYLSRDNLSDSELLSKIKKTAEFLVKDDSGTFRCQTTRSDKSFFQTSIQVNHQVGEFIEKHNFQLKFKLKDPNHVLGIELNDKGAFIYKDKIDCLGGLPAGIEGHVAVILENAASQLAALLMLKRGVAISLIINKNNHDNNINKNQELEKTKFIQKFSPNPIKIYHSIQNYQLSCVKRPCVVVSNKTLISLVKDYQLTSDSSSPKKSKIMYLYPLCGYTKKQITEQLKYYRSMISKRNIFHTIP